MFPYSSLLLSAVSIDEEEEEEEEPALIYHERLIDQTKHDSSDHLQARYTAHGVV
jgi:hypothetical protein